MKPGMIGSGIAAGFVATVVLSAMMLIKQYMGLLPQLNPIEDIVHVADRHHGAHSNARSLPDLWSGTGRHLWTRASRSAAAVSCDASVALDGMDTERGASA
jgi:hypothetical protein